MREYESERMSECVSARLRLSVRAIMHDLNVWFHIVNEARTKQLQNKSIPALSCNNPQLIVMPRHMGTFHHPTLRRLFAVRQSHFKRCSMDTKIKSTVGYRSRYF